jgi:predicted metal-dependent phosphoesterase TrpH
VTDHDTVAALDEAAAACAAEGLELVPGIEITSARGGRDVHVLGYFFDRRSAALLAFLEAQRADRVRRVREMLGRLRDLGVVVDEEEIFGTPPWPSARSAGRPLIARALVQRGHVRTTGEAFDLYLAEGRPAFVARRAPTPEEVVAILHQVGGIAALAHPALLGHDEWIPGLAGAGLDAIEAFYPDHTPALTLHYRTLAADLSLAVSGGSDYHGHGDHGPQYPGEAVLPEDEFAKLQARVPRGGAGRRGPEGPRTRRV